MKEKPTLEQLEPIALEFAKALIANDANQNSATLSRDAMKLASEWFKNQSIRQQVVDQQFPSWVDLRGLTDEQKAKYLHDGSEYWAIGYTNNQTGLTIGFGTYSQFLSLNAGPYFKASSGSITGIYALSTQDYPHKETPELPDGVTLPNPFAEFSN